MESVWLMGMEMVKISRVYLPLQDMPSPVYPVRHEQEKEPALLVQFADKWQLWEVSRHSSISVEKKERNIIQKQIRNIKFL